MFSKKAGNTGGKNDIQIEREESKSGTGGYLAFSLEKSENRYSR